MCEKHTMMIKQKIFSLPLNIVSLYKIFTHFCLDFSFLAGNGNPLFTKGIVITHFLSFSFIKLPNLFSYTIFYFPSIYN